MRVLVLYESLFGNTGTVAESVAEGLRAAPPEAVVECRRVDDPVAPDEFDLVVLGAPTHFWGLTGTLSRTMESQYERRLVGPRAPADDGAIRKAAATSGMRALLAALPPGRGRAAAAFDTCMTGPLTGGARRAIARGLEQAGYRLLAPPETFLVEAVAGPLRPGEAERARAWGAALGAALDEQDTPDWRNTMERQEQTSSAHPTERPSTALVSQLLPRLRAPLSRPSPSPRAGSAGRSTSPVSSRRPRSSSVRS